MLLPGSTPSFLLIQFFFPFAHAYGTIGKRVADAITKQDDIEVVGVVKAHPNYPHEILSPSLLVVCIGIE